MLRGRPLLKWSLDVLHAAGCSPAIVVVPEDSVAAARAIVGDDPVVVPGGPTRQESVAAGLAEVNADAVVVHDAARPFASVDLVERVLEALDAADGAVTAVPIDETLKRVSGSQVIGTVDRESLWRIQTPQAFRTSILKESHRRSRQEGFVATDDAQLVENYGGRVVIVEGSRLNLKLTFSEDFELAETIASMST